MNAVEDAKKEGRKPAPVSSDVFSDVSVGFRKAQIDRLNKENPKFEHLYGNPEWDAEEVRIRGLEVVRGESGPMHHKGDPVCRKPKEVWDAEQAADAGRSIDSVVETGVLEEESATRYRSPKQPRQKRKE